MNYIFCVIILVISPLSAIENVSDFCANGVFKCVSPTSLRICFNQQLVTSEFFCPNSTYCSEKANIICTNNTDFDNDYFSASEEIKLKSVTEPNLKCTEKGNFPIKNSLCQKYYKCIEGITGFLLKRQSCVFGQFDPVSQSCSTSYVCPEVECNQLKIPECTTTGYLSIPNTGCKKYVICKNTANGLTSTVKDCFTGGFFNPAVGRCERNYICSDTIIPEVCITVPAATETTTQSPNSMDSTTQSMMTNSTANNSNESKTTTTITDSTITNSTDSTTASTFFSIYSTTMSKITDLPITNFNNSGKPITTDLQKINFTDSTTSITDVTLSIITTETTISYSPVTNSTESTITDSHIINSTTTDLTVTDTTIGPEITTSITSTTTAAAECTKSGRFPVAKSGCMKYLLCTLTTHGILNQIYDCPANTLFDPVAQRCNTYYTCTEAAPTTTITTLIVEEATTESLSTVTYSQGKCKEQGKFQISNTYCKKYLNCILSTNGFFEHILECPDGKYFDPKVKKCSETYACSEIGTTINTVSLVTTPKSEVCKEHGKFVIANSGCKKYRSCIVTSSEFKIIELECPNGTSFDSDLKRCSTTYRCNENIAESTTAVNNGCLKENAVAFECTQAGRFPVIGNGCKKYILCMNTSTGFKGKEYECPKETNFNPNTRRCENNYLCTQLVCQTTTNFNVTEEMHSTEIIPSITFVVPTCLMQGKQEIPGTKCKKFLMCVKARQGFLSSIYSCPEGSFFHPIMKRCTESYVCEEDVRICTTIGRFPDSSDLDCKNYFDCAKLESNNIEGVKKECKGEHYFDPQLQLCSANYICQNKKVLLRKPIDKNVISPIVLVNGQCTTVGRYLVQLSNCKNYVYCSANTDGSLKQTNFTCPTTTVFNQAIQKCTSSTTYTCPDTLCVNNPGFTSWANPNVRDCSSYIVCQPVFNNLGTIIGFSGVVTYCPVGTKYNPALQLCDSMYVCSTNIIGK